jgi:hemerythrin-like domain-containing protein
MKTTAFLMDEHKQILRALNVLEAMANCTDQESIDEHDVEQILRFLRVFADEHHQGKEEAVLFPAMVHATKPAPRSSLNHMIFEHDQERSLVEGLEEALRTKKGKNFVYFAQRLVQILRTHIYKEDNILFELADEILSSEEDEKAATELQAYDRTWKDTALFGFLAELNRLEWKYLSRVNATENRIGYAQRH